LVSVYRNVSSAGLYGVAGATPKGSTVIVGLLWQPFQAWLEGDADALVAVAKPTPPTAIAAMAASPMLARLRRRHCLPIWRMMRSLRERFPT
jgi:hypothetical protein